MIKWRWDQGRLDYFQFDEIKKIAAALVDFDGKALPRGDDPDGLRAILEQYSQRPFAPMQYKVWRNYKRVFGCQLLATDVGGLLVCTDLCKEIASGDIDSDEYLIELGRRFYYSSPVFDEYSVNDMQIFPICGIIKLLVYRYLYKDEKFVSIEDIINFVKGAGVTGSESPQQFSHMKSTRVVIASDSDEFRQIREMLRFISQLSFLKWNTPYLFLDVKSKKDAEQVARLFNPVINPRNGDSSLELLHLGRTISKNKSVFNFKNKYLNPFDVEFSEGSKLRITHIRTERSGKLREFYFKYAQHPNHCDMCELDTKERYPWSERILELHHLLPLSSPIRVEKNTSSLKDLVGLCPTCHRATHKYYSKWFKLNAVGDFKNYQEAKEIYMEAKKKVII